MAIGSDMEASGGGGGAQALSAGMGINVLGGLTNAYVGYQNAKQKRKVASWNADMAFAQSWKTMEEGTAQELAMRRQANQVIGEQAAATAQSGIGYGGTAADLMKQSLVNRELDALTIRYKASTQAAMLRSQGEWDNYQAAGFRREGESAVIDSLTGTSSKVLTGYGYGVQQGYWGQGGSNGKVTKKTTWGD